MSKSTPVPAGHKRCPRCPEGEQVQPLTHFFQFRTGKVSGYCKSCTREANQRAYRQRSDRQGRPRVPNAIPIVDGQKLCVGECDAVKPLDQFYRHGNGYRRLCKTCMAPTYRVQYQRTPRSARASEARAVKSEWKCTCGEHDSHRAHIYSRNADWRRTNPERHRESNRLGAIRRRVANPEPVREAGRRAASQRRARRRGLPSDHYTWAQLLERDGKNCVLCGRVLNLAVEHPHPMSPTTEHLECLSWPNSPGNVLTNVALSHFTCNTRRRDRPHPAAARKRAELLDTEGASA